MLKGSFTFCVVEPFKLVMHISGLTIKASHDLNQLR